MSTTFQLGDLPGSLPSHAGLDVWMDSIDHRLHDVEQIVTSPDVMGSTPPDPTPEFETITIGDILLEADPPEPVTGVVVTPGTFFDNIFADVEWVESPTGPVAVTFDVELAERDGAVYTLLNVLSTAGTGGRFNNLQPNRNYGVRIIPVNALGVRGATPAWTDFTTGIDSTVPPAPTGVVLARGATTVVVKYTPLTAAEAADVANGHGLYEIEIDTNVAFNTANLRSMRSGDQVVAFNDVLTEGSWVARVRAIDSSGNVGPWSATSSSLTAGGVNDSMLIADISAAKITAGFLSASRIQAGTLSADKLMTSSLTAAEITLDGGSFKAGNPPTTGILFNSQGIRGYSGGSLTFVLDAATGAATFVGNISGSSITGGSISGTTISGATITGNTISGGTINGTTITGTNITGGTVTGATIGTATSGQRVVLTTGGVIQFFNSSGTFTGQLVGEPTGSYAVEVRNSGGGLGYLQSGGIVTGPVSASSVFSTGALTASGYSNLNDTETQELTILGNLWSTNIYNTLIGGSFRNVHVRSDGLVGYFSSSTIRVKDNIRKLSKDKVVFPDLSSRVLDLDLVSFYFKEDEEDRYEQFGVIAEWVDEIMGEYAPWFIVYDEEGKPDNVHLDRLALALIPHVKQLEDRVKVLESS